MKKKKETSGKHAGRKSDGKFAPGNEIGKKTDFSARPENINTDGRPEGAKSISTLLNDLLDRPIAKDKGIELMEQHPSIFSGNEKINYKLLTAFTQIQLLSDPDPKVRQTAIVKLADLIGEGATKKVEITSNVSEYRGMTREELEKEIKDLTASCGEITITIEEHSRLKSIEEKYRLAIN